MFHHQFSSNERYDGLASGQITRSRNRLKPILRCSLPVHNRFTFIMGQLWLKISPVDKTNEIIYSFIKDKKKIGNSLPWEWCVRVRFIFDEIEFQHSPKHTHTAIIWPPVTKFVINLAPIFIIAPQIELMRL